MRKALPFAIIAGALLLARPAAAATPVKIGDRAPNFNAATLAGRQISLAGLRGKVVVLDFFATWCGPCRAEVPDLIALYKELVPQGVALVAIDDRESASVVRVFADAQSVPYPVVADTGGKIDDAYGVHSYPTYMAIDARGIVRAVSSGFGPGIAGQLKADVTLAQHGRSDLAEGTAPLQALAQLLDPSQFSYTGPSPTILANARNAAQMLQMAAMIAGNMKPADRAAAEKTIEALRRPTAAALARLGTPQAAELAAEIDYDSAWGARDWKGAVAAATRMVAAQPKDAKAWSDLENAYDDMHDYGAELSVAKKAAQLVESGDALFAVATVYAEHKDLKPYDEWADRALKEQLAQAARSKSDADYNDAASIALQAGDEDAKAGETARAHALYQAAIANARIEHVPQGASATPSPEAMMAAMEGGAKIIGQAQEHDAALYMYRDGKLHVSIAPWTGADLPGSSPSTLKYKMLIVDKPGTSVNLRASDLASGWLATFCTDDLCSPMQRTIVVPSDGVQTVELQFVPSGANATSQTQATIETSDTVSHVSSVMVIKR